MNEQEARAWLCQAMPTIRQRWAGTPHESRLDALVADVRADGEVAEAADALRRELGLPRPATVRGGFDQPAMVGIGGIGSGHPVPETFACPAGKCPRTWTRQPGMTVPQCHLYGGRLT